MTHSAKRPLKTKFLFPVDDTTMLSRIEWAMNISLFSVAIGVAGEFIGNQIAGPIRKRLDRAKEAEIARLNKEAGKARKAAGEAMERVASAEKQAAGLNKKAEEERLARAQIEERLAHRKVSPGQAKILNEELHSLKGHKIVVTTAALQPESVEYAKQLTDAL